MIVKIRKWKKISVVEYGTTDRTSTEKKDPNINIIVFANTCPQVKEKTFLMQELNFRTKYGD